MAKDRRVPVIELARHAFRHMTSLEDSTTTIYGQREANLFARYASFPSLIKLYIGFHHCNDDFETVPDLEEDRVGDALPAIPLLPKLRSADPRNFCEGLRGWNLRDLPGHRIPWIWNATFRKTATRLFRSTFLTRSESSVALILAGSCGFVSPELSIRTISCATGHFFGRITRRNQLYLGFPR